MKSRRLPLVCVLVLAGLVVAACPQAAAPPAPTAAPAKPAAEPTKAPAAAPTAAPVAVPTAAPAPAKLAYPEKGKSVTFIVPWAAGSPNDVWARLAANYMEIEMGVPIQVVDKPGATSQVGMTELSLAKPDGYTIGVDSLQTTILTYLDPERKAVFTRKNFEPIAVTAMEPFGMITKGGGKYKTLKDLVDAAKANPEKIQVGTNGLMSPSHLSSALLAKAAGVKFAFVHFAGSNQQVAALLGDHIQAGSVMATGLAPQFKSGTLAPLGVFDKSESPAWPGVKTVLSQGWNSVVVRTVGVDAPAGTPKEIVAYLAGILKKVHDNPEYQKKTQEASMITKYMGTAEYAGHWSEDEGVMKAAMAAIK